MSSVYESLSWSRGASVDFDHRVLRAERLACRWRRVAQQRWVVDSIPDMAFVSRCEPGGVGHIFRDIVRFGIAGVAGVVRLAVTWSISRMGSTSAWYSCFCCSGCGVLLVRMAADVVECGRPGVGPYLLAAVPMAGYNGTMGLDVTSSVLSASGSLVRYRSDSSCR